jgi:carboxyl-terminal processing protease
MVLGSSTFGKGSVQSIYGPLEDGSGLRLTVALYYTPNGTSIQAKGIVPDVKVERDEWEYKPSNQKTIREKDLTRHLEDEGKPKEGETEGLTEAQAKDVQLLRALELLKGWYVFRTFQTPPSQGGQEAESDD